MKKTIITLVFAAYSFTSFSMPCEEQCKMPRSCTEYIDCRIAEVECMSDCSQLRVSEKFLVVLDKLILAIENLNQRLSQEDKKESLSSSK